MPEGEDPYIGRLWAAANAIVAFSAFQSVAFIYSVVQPATQEFLTGALSKSLLAGISIMFGVGYSWAVAVVAKLASTLEGYNRAVWQSATVGRILAAMLFQLCAAAAVLIGI